MSTDIISPKVISNALKAYNVSAEVFDELVSTNQTAKEKAASGAKEGTLIIAKHQTGGKGRMGRTFFSPDQSGVYFSLILKPILCPEDCLLITTAAAVAVCKAIESVFGKSTSIKWVNDIFINDKKVCGILSEASFDSSNKLDYVILGIGINLYPPSDNFPKDIADIAGAITNIKQSENKNRLIINIIKAFFGYYSNLKKLDFLPEYQSRMLLIGKNISFTKNGNVYSAKVIGIDNACRLTVELSDGQICSLSAGEVTIGSKTINQ